MNLTFKVKDSKEYYVITKSDHFGYNLTHHKPTLKEDAKKEFTQSSLFYANLSQIADKLSWVALEGSNLDEIIVSLSSTAENIAKTLTKGNV
jgi:hypothetical protein